MTTTADRAAEARRLAVFAWNLTNAKWGRFSVADLGYPIRCGVCGLEYPDQMAKADHLRTEHDAEVVVMQMGGESFYEWRR